MDKATIRVFAEVIAENAQQMHDDLSEDRDGRGKAITFVTYGVAWALADPGLAQEICMAAVGEQSFEKMRQATSGMAGAMRGAMPSA